MKKGLILVVFLLLLPIVKAAITIEGPSKPVYNLGDKLEVNGYILENKDMFGFFRLDLVCESSLQLLVRTVNLKENEKYAFSESLPIPPFLTGKCNIQSSLEVDNIAVDNAASKEFIISKSLKGTFELKEKRIQVGKDIYLIGSISKLDGTSVDGIATIYLKQNDINYFIDTINFEKGDIEYTHNTAKTPSGVYDLEISVNDLYGNQQLFTNISQFTIIGEIYIIAKPAKLHVLPGSSVVIFGEAKTILQEPVKEATVYILFNGTKYQTNLRRSKYEYPINIPNDIKTGTHTVDVSIEEVLGNVGNTTTTIYVDAVPTELKTELNEKSFNPGSKLIINPLLIDQAGDLIIESISIDIIDSRNKKVLSEVKQTNQKLEFNLPEFSNPGTWTIRTYATGLKHEDKIYISEISKLDFSLLNQTLYVKNVGNVKYKKSLEIILKSSAKETKITERLSLNVDQSSAIKLGKGVPSGVYDIFVGGIVFKDVNIIGLRGKMNYTWLYRILIILAVLSILIWFIFKRKKVKKLLKQSIEEKKKAAEILRKLRQEKPILSEEEEKQKRIRDFRIMLAKDIESRERKNFKPFKFKPKQIKEEIIIEVPKEKIKTFDISEYKIPNSKEREEIRKKALKNEEEMKEGLFNMFD